MVGFREKRVHVGGNGANRTYDVGIVLARIGLHAAIAHVEAAVEGDAGRLRLANAQRARRSGRPGLRHRPGNLRFQGRHVGLAHATERGGTAVAACDGSRVGVRAADEHVAAGDCGCLRYLLPRIDDALFPDGHKVARDKRDCGGAIVNYHGPRVEIVMYRTRRSHMVIPSHVRAQRR